MPTAKKTTATKTATTRKTRTTLPKIPLPGDEPRRKVVQRPYGSPDVLFRAMNEYFTTMEEAGEFPDEAGMRLHLRLGHDSYRSYQEDPDYQKVFEWAMDKRESWLARALIRNPKSAQAYLNALKQPKNGGWVDRKADSGDNTLRIISEGVGGEEAFR